MPNRMGTGGLSPLDEDEEPLSFYLKPANSLTERQRTKLEWAGGVIILIDLLSWVFWIGITATLVHHHDERANVGFLALTAPHTLIIPTVLAILHDFWSHCSKEQGLCASIETPPYQWVVFPFLVAPLDILTLWYNIVVVKNKYVVAASVWALADTVLVIAWGVLATIYLYPVHPPSSPPPPPFRAPPLPASYKPRRHAKA